ncbi:ParB N-terminal domain-containing protein [Marinovum sp. 2_MG-2023]|uniref:ParB/RepB/Spo0J family partition protein n=1 Tax=unclassified Marinovum TaxID=2647166 RepID=UPI0026E25D34|nr:MULTISPECIES: ParB N-terminal domain-containing protein [unclassified Marinovum]MDO6729201.1 ParB N-terminal domain-containing protein [Marinovum sp. 2_MG-2023]MDO6779172.1 ParB N-terminal domain-containing protein [Marinovum sp. 1_MG-2023]
MARRRQLEPPSPEALKELEEGFARETPRSGSRIPIADVVGEAAAMSTPIPAEARAEHARDKVDAERLREAETDGRLVTLIPINNIRIAGISRDRLELDAEELTELAMSICDSGLRLPIEVFRSEKAGDEYTLISGYRRLEAFRQLVDLKSKNGDYTRIPAFIRDPESQADVYVAMIEENEIRVGLSQYERGRAAAMAVYDGVFPTLDEAVNKLFRNASKAKRSKIRSFAMIHEEMGDMLEFATGMNERQCLRLATALRAGQGPKIREALEAVKVRSLAEEWAEMLPFIEEAEGAEPNPSRGGRPKAEKRLLKSAHKPLVNGMSITKETGPRGYAIRFHGPVTDEMVEECISRIEYLLGENQ